MKWAWVRPGGNPDIPTLLRKARAWSLERVIWDANDPQINPDTVRFNGLTYLQEFRRQGAIGSPVVGGGLTRSPDWDNGRYAAAAAFAEKVSDDLTRHGYGSNTKAESCVAILNRETPHDPVDQLAMLTRWRELRPTRLSAWAVESMQGGWVRDQALSAFLRADPGLWIVGELYFGMPRQYPVSEWRVREDLIGPGTFNDGQIKAYYDAERQPVPWGWDGILYDFSKCPDRPVVPL